MKQFNVPGIYHPIKVKLVTRKWLSKYTKDKNIMGFWDPNRGCIYVVRELTTFLRIHTFWHEMSHHIIDTLKEVKNDENKADLLGSHQMRLNKKAKHIVTNLKRKKSK